MSSFDHTTSRETTIDALRGCAVIAMILAHAIFFFHNGTNHFLNTIEYVSNIIIFTLFVFVSGAASSKTLDKYAHIGPKHQIKRALFYAGNIYLIYAIATITAIITSLPDELLSKVLPKIAGALTFATPVNFTEYIPLFIFLPLTTIFFHQIYRISRTNIFLTLCIGLGAYVVGLLLYPLQLPIPFNYIKELFAGGNNLLRFPLLFYFPIYMFGLWWEYHMEHGSERAIDKHHVIFLCSTTLVAIASIVFSWQYDLPVFAPSVRWPPSIGFLTIGLSMSTILAFFLSIVPMESWIKGWYRFTAYLGRDALDLWVTHLILLFLYRKYVHLQFGDGGTVLFLFCMTLLVSSLLSSIALTNTISVSRIGPIAFAPEHGRRLRKRYGILAVVLGITIIWSVTSHPVTTLYGSPMSNQSFSLYNQPPIALTATISTDTLWHLRYAVNKKPIRLTLLTKDTNTHQSLNINPTNVTISIDTTSMNLVPVRSEKGALFYEINPSLITPGTYDVSATISNTNGKTRSNTLSIIISDPLLVAWTLDWEGWDVTDDALKEITQISNSFGSIPFTHFVNPRMFLNTVLEPARAKYLANFILGRMKFGDEIALHAHMHYDLVRASSVTPKTTPHWGLESADGYDVPATAYSEEEFRKIVSTAKTILTTLGFPQPSGFRSGGWFITGSQLTVLHDLGFLYDTSARDKATSGAFKNVPWDLPITITPYYPDRINPNKANQTHDTTILEIPNNGVTTYESTAKQLLERSKQVYTAGVLDTPKTLIYTSHPQFASKEFSRIPQVLIALNEQSIVKDKGPIVFVTMSDIYSLWKSLPY